VELTHTQPSGVIMKAYDYDLNDNVVIYYMYFDQIHLFVVVIEVNYR